MFLSVKNLNHGDIVNFSDVLHLPKRRFDESPEIQLRNDDILLVKDGAGIGKSGIVKKLRRDATINSSLLLVRVGDILDPEFFHAFVRSLYFQNLVVEKTTGSTTPHLFQRDIKALPIRIPPRREQSRIKSAIEAFETRSSRARDLLSDVGPLIGKLRRSVLHCAFSGRLTSTWRQQDSRIRSAGELLKSVRAKRRGRWEAQQIANYEAKGKKPPRDWRDKYKEPESVDDSRLPELPEGWCWVTMNDLPKDEPNAFTIGPFGSNLKVRDYRDEGVPLVFVREIRAESFGDNNTKFVTPEKANELSSHQVEGGDLLITKMGDPPGDTAIYPESRPDAVITADCIKLAPDPRLTSSEFLRYWLRATPMLDRILEETKGVAQRKLSLKRFRAIVMPLPPKAEQDEIVEQIEIAMEPCAEVERGLASMESTLTQLNQSILSTAFRGELVPQDPTDEPASKILANVSIFSPINVTKKVSIQEPIEMPLNLEEVGVNHLQKILKRKRKSLTPHELWQESNLEIRDFYSQLDKEIADKKVVETKSRNSSTERKLKAR